MEMTQGNLRRLLRKQWLGDSKGSAALEFAMCAPVFILALIGAFEMMMMFWVQMALEGAAREAARYGAIGSTEVGLTRDQAIQKKVEDTVSLYTGGFVQPTDIKVDAKMYAGLANVRNPEPYVDTNADGSYQVGEPYIDVNGNGVWDADQGVSGSFGLSGQVVEYDISYEWPTIVPGLWGGKNKKVLHAKTIIQNEPY